MNPNIYIEYLKSEKTNSGALYGQFIIHSLKQGQGVTVGNQFRRILLNDLEGCAISGVRFGEINSEFSTIPGVQEDILEILLNLKGIVLKSKLKTPQFGRLKLQGPAVVTADLIQLPSSLKIINPNQYILTISSTQIIEIEFKIEYGRGYKLASQTFNNEDDAFLQLDSVFMPVQKANYKIENIYNKHNEIEERVFLDIWTNGSISPKKALLSAAQINVDLFTLLIKNSNKPNIVNEPKPPKIKSYTNILIEELELSVRAYNCLKKAQINTIGDLLNYSPTQLQKLRNFGKKSSEEVFLKLKNKIGIIFK